MERLHDALGAAMRDEVLMRERELHRPRMRCRENEGGEDRQHALASPPPRLEREAPEPLEADRVDEAGRKPHPPAS